MVEASTLITRCRNMADSINDPIIEKQLRDISDIIETTEPLFHDKD